MRLETILPQPAEFNRNTKESLDNTIIFSNCQEKYYYPNHKTPYLFVTNFQNPGDYLLNHHPIRITSQCFYFLNKEDELEITFNQKAHLQTLIILFRQEFIEGAFRATVVADDKLLENPDDKGSYHIHQIPSVPFTSNSNILEQIQNIFQNPLNEEEGNKILLNLVSTFLIQYTETANQIMRLPVVKKSTRQELYKRLFHARQYMHDNVGRNIGIDDLAKEACMDKFHFLKTFKKLYNITPHQYFIDLKLRKAHDLLKDKNCSVGEVCNAIGFESIYSFSNLFKRRFHVSPSGLMKTNRNPNFR